MRLDDIDTSDVEVDDQRGQGGGGFPMGGGGGLPLGRSMGCGTILIVILIALFSRGDLGSLMDSGGSAPTQAIPQSQSAAGTGCDADALSKQSCQVLKLGNQTWAGLFPSGQYRKPHIAFYTQQGQSGCGAAQSAMGPFYCPADEGIYIDTDFYRELQQRFGAKGDFAQDYVIAHELGHHIQKLTGVADHVQEVQQNSSRAAGNREQVKMELQADCYAGVWAARNADRMDPGDLEEGLTAAHAIGDDVLQQQSQGVVVEASFTHGSAQQRMTWLKRGLQTGDPKQCDTFN